MWQLSLNALQNNNLRRNDTNIIIGYFSGSITHNSDLEMIEPAIIKILKEYNNVKLLIFGQLTIPEELNNFNQQIIKKNFTDWRKLPQLISNVDINIAPIEDSIFNQAKSENKWLEAALVKVPTIASNVGAFKDVIIHNETGLLCNNVDDWYISFKALIDNKELRNIIGENAHKICKNKYNTIYSGKKLSNYINSIASKNIGILFLVY